MSQKVLVVGTGYVGRSLTNALLAKTSHSITACDVNINALRELKTSWISASNLDIWHLGHELESARNSSFDVALITVPTPLTQGKPDLTAVEQACELAVKSIRPGGLIVLESTVGPGDTEKVIGGLIELRKQVQPEFQAMYGYSPERIDPGNAEFNLTNTPKIVAGANRESALAMKEFYKSFVSNLIPAKSIIDAEVAKLLENTYRLVNIALINEVASAASLIGADIRESIRLASTKPFGFHPFQPGLGAGGHCIPVDPKYLQHALEENYEQSLIARSLEINQSRPREIALKIELIIEKFACSRDENRKTSVLCYGLSYKPNIVDTRNSAAYEIATFLSSNDNLEIVVYEPHGLESPTLPPSVRRVGREDLLRAEFDVLVNLVLHDQWVDDSSIIQSSVLIDCFSNPGRFSGRSIVNAFSD
jgi:nucleotide sugar dehydrogenase